MTYLKGNTQFRISAERKRIKFHHFDKSVEVPFPVQDVQARVFKIYQLGQTSNSQKLARFSFYKTLLVKKYTYWRYSTSKKLLFQRWTQEL